MADGLSMDTAGTSQALSALGTAGTTLAQSWSTARSTIDSLSGQLGAGPLGQAFMRGYQTTATSVSQAMDSAAAVPQELAGTGQQSVTNYTQVDQKARTAYSGL